MGPLAELSFFWIYNEEKINPQKKKKSMRV